MVGHRTDRKSTYDGEFSEVCNSGEEELIGIEPDFPIPSHEFLCFFAGAPQFVVRRCTKILRCPGHQSSLSHAKTKQITGRYF